ncbi:hypothetical protein DE146DRAFT_754927 [Phaeosphaeria sp. MPI-PUGE-AT-0046c]|nr:hypothetical protein DE146DRAFT_754927 [Phaeosphaeria sp. MPI-PUGE-AT-0046c]
MGGRIPSIRVYNEHGDFIGKAPSSDSSYVSPGGWVTITVDQQGAGRSQQATFLEVAGADGDPVCVSYIGQTWSDGTRLAWVGDIGKYCRKPWYYSDLYVSMPNGTLYKPRCMWIGQGVAYNPGTTDQTAANIIPAIQIHTPNFGRQTESGGISVPANPSTLCGPPYMTFFTESRFDPTSSAGSRTRAIAFLAAMDLFGVVAGAVAKHVPKFVDQPQVKEAFGGRLVSSYHGKHTAKEICVNEFSLGPDFVSFSDNTFCDMETKTAWPLCDAEHSKGCFDWETKTLVIGMFRKRELKYSKVVEWT